MWMSRKWKIRSSCKTIILKLLSKIAWCLITMVQCQVLSARNQQWYFYWHFAGKNVCISTQHETSTVSCCFPALPLVRTEICQSDVRVIAEQKSSIGKTNWVTPAFWLLFVFLWRLAMNHLWQHTCFYRLLWFFVCTFPGTKIWSKINIQLLLPQKIWWETASMMRNVCNGRSVCRN